MPRTLLAILMFSTATPAIAQSAPRTVGPEPDARVYNWIDAQPKKGMRRYEDFTAKSVDRTYTNIGVRIQDESERVTIDGGTWRDAGSPESIGAAFSLVAGSMIVRNVTAVGNYDPSVKPKADFPNRDGIMGAQRTSLYVDGGAFRNYWDAGIDTKAYTTLVNTVTVENSRVSLKVWGPLVGDTLVSRNARDGDLACLKSPVVTCSLTLRKLVVWNDDPKGLLIGFQGNDGVVNVAECELHVPPTYRIRWDKAGNKNTKANLGPTCVNANGSVHVYVPPVADGIYVTYPTDADGDHDGTVVASGKVSAFGKAGTRWTFVEKTPEGYRYKKVP